MSQHRRRSSFSDLLRIPKLKRTPSMNDLMNSASIEINQSMSQSLQGSGKSSVSSRRELNDKFVEDIQQMKDFDQILTFLKENEQRIGLTQHGLYDLTVCSSRIQLFRLDPLKRKIFIHMLSLARNDVDVRMKIIKMISEKESDKVDLFVNDLIDYFDERTDFEGDPVFSDNGEIILISRQKLNQLLFERYGFDTLDQWMIYGHYKMFSEKELMDIIQMKCKGISKTSTITHGNSSKYKKIVSLISNCIMSKEIVDEENLTTIKSLLQTTHFKELYL